MFQSLFNVVKTGAAFLQNGAVPPNTPPDQVEQMANTNHLSSKKFFLAFTGFIILGIFYVVSILILFRLKGAGDLIPAYTTIFTKTMEVFAVVMATYLGGQAMVDLRYNSSSSANMSGQVNSNTTTQTVDITQTIVRAKDDDYTLELEE